jgi:hypothetical protein
MEWLQTQLALAHWHLDAATSAAADAVRVHRQKAQEIYTRMVNSLARANLNPDERPEIERRIEGLASRLEPESGLH